MKLKKVLAGVMAFVFSLNLIHINVNAKVKTEDAVSSENSVSSKEEVETNTTKEVVAKIIEKSANGISTVVKLAFTGIKSLLKLVGVGIKYAAMGACMTVGGVLVIKAPDIIDAIQDKIDEIKDRFQSKSELDEWGC